MGQQPPGERERVLEGLRQLVPLVDIIGLSHYPHFGKFNAFSIPAYMYDSLFETLEEVGAGSMPIAVTESGYSADPYTIFETPFPATPELQDRYLKHLFYELEAPVQRVAAADVPTPYASNLEKLALPDAARIVEAVLKITL